MAVAADPETSGTTQTVSGGGLNMQPNEAATGLPAPTGGCGGERLWFTLTDGTTPAARGQACPKPFVQRIAPLHPRRC